MSYSHFGLVRAITDALLPFVVPVSVLDAQGNLHREMQPLGYMERRAIAEQAAHVAELLAKKQGLPP